LIVVALFSITYTNAQVTSQHSDSVWNSYIDISKVGLEKKIQTLVSSSYVEKNVNPVTDFPGINFTPGILHTGSVPIDYVTKKIILKFNIFNPGDTNITVFFCPGFYYSHISLYKSALTGIQVLPVVLPNIKNGLGYRGITLSGQDSVVIIAELSFVKTYNNSVRPRLIDAKYLPAFIAELHSGYLQTDMFTYVFCGLLLMMMLFSIANYSQHNNTDFLYYCGYAFFLGGMLFIQTIFHFNTSQFSYFLEGYLDFILQSTGIIFYMLFMQRFLNTRTKYPFLYKLYNTGIGLLLASIAAYSIFHHFTDNYRAEYFIESITKIVLLILILIFLVYSIRHRKDVLLRYLFWGNLFLFIFSLVSQLAIFLSDIFKGLPGVLSSSIIYYETGLLLELVFFLAGLNYKNRLQLITQTKERETLRTQNQLQLYEKEIAVYKAQQEERQRISEDMHDELGSGMTAIRLLSEIARNKMKENTPVEIEKISSSADDVLNKMNAIIWSMNSGNDTLDNLISYIRSWSLEYYDNLPVSCKVITPEIIPDIEIMGEKRRNIFLCIKESLNNILKHSMATQVIISIEVNHSIKIKITDNGVGIDLENIRQFGNGLKNISQRMKTIGGTFKIENNNGTITTLEIPF
jgi:signal transduction histidine kinase